ncbi:hypothetical protein MPLB_1290007 [Mesorhizobium sp. ORS 3324]|nr:hypothetical protein MPLB_1290007 [Mesorhizobium sp. ORS 3324]
MAPPLIPLPGPSPRIVTGRRGWPPPRHFSCNAGSWRNCRRERPSPRHYTGTIRGEDAGRQVRGGADAANWPISYGGHFYRLLRPNHYNHSPNCAARGNIDKKFRRHICILSPMCRIGSTRPMTGRSRHLAR